MNRAPHAMRSKWLAVAGPIIFVCAVEGPVNGQEYTGLQAAQVMQQAMVQAIERAEKSVVAIARVRRDASGGFDPPDPRSPDFVPNEFGTGVIIDRRGYIVTNFHVLGDPKKHDYFVWVGRRPFKAAQVFHSEKVTAGDPWTDLAVLKINADDLTPIVFGDASQLKKGMIVIVLGNPYAIARDGQPSASWGIIANLSRSAPPNPRSTRTGSERETLHHYGTLIQTDARLNLGTSGGALVNLKGEMIGLTTALAAMAGFERGAGFAIPVDDVFRRTLEALKAGRQPEFGFLGVQPDHLSYAERQQGRFGARVTRIVPGSPADRAGIREDDVITQIDGVTVHDRDSLFRELSKRPALAPLEIGIERVDASGTRRRPVSVSAVLSKKYVDTARPAYSDEPVATWRGLHVEYATALPPLLARQFNGFIDPQGCIGVLDVQRDSPAWAAGLRPGDFISHVENSRISTPQEFFDAVAPRDGDVQLHLTVGTGSDAIRTVPGTNG